MSNIESKKVEVYKVRPAMFLAITNINKSLQL